MVRAKKDEQKPQEETQNQQKDEESEYEVDEEESDSTQVDSDDDFVQDEEEIPKQQVAVKTRGKAAKTQAAQVQQTSAKVDTVINLEELQSLGIGHADIKNLNDAAIFTVQGLQMRPSKELLQVKGISEAKLAKILAAAEKLHPTDTFSTAKDVLAYREQLLRIPTGAKSIDALFDGGLMAEQIVQIFGEYRTGKTQLCMTLAVAAQHPLINHKISSKTYKVVYIDTENTFRPERIKQIAKRFKLDPQETLNNIYVVRAHNSEDQQKALSVLPKFLSQYPFSLVVVDSIVTNFRQDYQGRGELADRQQHLIKHLQVLQRIAEEYHLLVIVTNQVMAIPDAMSFGADKKAIGGHVLSHATQMIISLKKAKGNQRKFVVEDAPDMANVEGIFELGEGGVMDAE